MAKSSGSKVKAEGSGKKPVTFSLKAEGAKSVVVTGCFCDWHLTTHKLKKNAEGIWQKTLQLEPGRYEYRFIVDGEWADDPACTERVPNSFGSQNCVLDVT